MKTSLLIAAASILATAAAADHHAIKVGVLVGLTGPVESFAPSMAASAELALAEASDSGLLLGGKVIKAIRADSTCVDAAAATAAAERLVTAEGVAAIVGADCSGVTTAVANNVAVPNGVVMVSPSATSPSLTRLDDKGFFFRTAPSDARHGKVLAGVVKGRGIGRVAITYTNNDYGKGMSESFATAYRALGGEVAVSASHEDGRADYTAEVAALAAAGAEHLVVFGYADQGGKSIVQAALDSGAFDRFIFGDGMISDKLAAGLGAEMAGSFGTLPGTDGAGADGFLGLAAAAGFDGSSPYCGEAYDAAALILLAMQAAGSAERDAIRASIMSVANAPGVPIYPGELAKALEILAAGGEVNYVGATNVELSPVGEAAGTYKEVEVKDEAFVTVTVH